MTEDNGNCCIVLHTHLPWVAHHGAWPVGEEWFHQAWAQSYLPLTEMFARWADEGRRDVLTLGVTPVVAAMLDDPYLLRQLHTWLGDWQVRAWQLAERGGKWAELAAYEHRRAAHAIEAFESQWCHGGSPTLRALAGSGVVELLGGPATHPFQPAVADDRLIDAQLELGLDDHALRFGRRPHGIWAPECGYRPGLENNYDRAGVDHFLVDGPTLIRGAGTDATSAPWQIGDSGVRVVGRDLEVTYRVWSPRAGYPGGKWYRDFHHYDHPTGFRAFRVTGKRVADDAKAVYDPAQGHAATRADAEDFVRVVRERLDHHAARLGRPGLVVVAYDTELFGHWWHEGPTWLDHVVRLLPEAGVTLRTVQGALGAHPAERVELPAGSWGSGKDDRVWTGETVAPVVAESREVQRRLLDIVDKHVGPRSGRHGTLDQLWREALLVMASDWAFLVTKNSAADYAMARHRDHVERFTAIAEAVSAARWERAEQLAEEARAVDGLFGHADARQLARGTIAQP